MISLLVQRAAVLMLRPAAMAAEALFVPGGNIMIFAIPIAALALTASSVPVHSQYMVATPNTPNLRALERSYVSGLLYISVISVAVLFLSLILIWKGVSLELVAITLSMFVIEKFSDELTRFYEFQKKYSRWFIAQSVRSIWLLVPVACYNLGADYLHSFFIASMSIAVITLVNFFFSTHLRPSLSPTGWQAIRTNAVFLSSSFLLAIHRQAPRIAVAFAFPKVAHFFQIVAQVGQVVSLLFNVKYVIPYRAVMSRRPRLFERMLSAAFLKIIQAVIAMLVLASLAIPVADLPLGHEIMMVALTVAMVADALAFS
ncbi:hypothetical protein, partial [Sphingopyxis sp.]|uniref:hypothetical protein n=1 Tax=Sphingopyxis sp. TaxID=1908224 RepID=UPI002EDA02DC